MEDNGTTFAESGVYFQIAENAEFRQFSVSSQVCCVPHRGTERKRIAEFSQIRQIAPLEEILLQHTAPVPDFTLQIGNGN